MPSGIRHLLLYAHTVIVALLSIACEPKNGPTSAQQPVGKLNLPEYSADNDPIANLQADGELSFQGSVIIWQDDPDLAGMQKILAASRSQRLAQAALKQHETATVTPLKRDLLQARDELARVEQQSREDEVLHRVYAEKSRQWLEEQRRQLHDNGIISFNEFIRAEDILAYYCEAKIWELAVNPLILAHRFTQRPTPSQLCEDIYEKLSLFRVPECEDAQNDEPKSYFECLWRGGVFQTRLFIDRFDIPCPDGVFDPNASCFEDSPTEVKADKLHEWLDDGTLKAQLLGERAQMLRGAALSHGRLGSSRIFGRIYKKVFVPAGGTPIADDTLDFAQASPILLIQNLEISTTSSLDPIAGIRLTSDGEAIRTFYANLYDMAFRSSSMPSVSDFLFNQSAEGVTAPLNIDQVKVNPAFSFIFDAIDPEFKRRIDALNQTIASLEAGLASAEEESQRRLVVLTEILQQSAHAATAEGVTSAFWPTSKMRVRKLTSPDNDEPYLEIQFFLNTTEGEPVYLCWSLETEVTIPCKNAQPTKTLSSLNYDAEFGLLEFSVDLKNPISFGFHLPPRDRSQASDAFCDLDPDQMRGKTLRFVAEPTLINEVLFLYSGRVHILDGDTELHEGAFTLSGI